LLCSIELWLRFVVLAVQRLVRLRSPLTIYDGDVLARALFSGHVKKNGRTLRPNAFLINTKSEFGISVHRWSLAPSRLFTALGLAAARRRGINFKGFAEFDAKSLAKAVLEDWQLQAVGAPMVQDAFHADILLPRDREEDFYLLVASEFVERIKPTTQPYR